MTAGAPRITNRDIDRQNHDQAAGIHAMAARNVPHDDIAAAHGCTLARVRAVLAQPAPDSSDRDDDESVREPQGRLRVAARNLSTSALLDAATGHDDARVARLADHINADLTVLRQMLVAEQERAQHAEHMRRINTRLANLHTANAAAHRRRSDGISA